MVRSLMKKEVMAIVFGIFLIGFFNLVIANETGQKSIANSLNCTTEDNCIKCSCETNQDCGACYHPNCLENKCVYEKEEIGQKNETKRYQYNETNRKPQDQENNGIGLGQMIRNRVKAGVYTNENGEEIRVSELAQNRIRLNIRNISVDCDDNCNLSDERIGNKTRLKIHFRNGNESEIKIMPDVASQRALERLKLKFCNESNNCTMNLKEIQNKKETRGAYEMQIERHKKLLGLFKMKAQERTQIDSETGEVISVNRPWWAALASSMN